MLHFPNIAILQSVRFVHSHVIQTAFSPSCWARECLGGLMSLNGGGGEIGPRVVAWFALGRVRWDTMGLLRYVSAHSRTPPTVYRPGVWLSIIVYYYTLFPPSYWDRTWPYQSVWLHLSSPPSTTLSKGSGKKRGLTCRSHCKIFAWNIANDEFLWSWDVQARGPVKQLKMVKSALWPVFLSVHKAGYNQYVQPTGTDLLSNTSDYSVQ